MKLFLKLFAISAVLVASTTFSKASEMPDILKPECVPSYFFK